MARCAPGVQTRSAGPRGMALSTALVLSLLLSPAGAAQEPRGVPGHRWSSGAEAGRRTQAESRRLVPGAPAGTVVRLAAPTRSVARGLPAKTRLPIGFQRRLPREARVLTAADLVWEPARGGGSVAAVAVRSPGARGVRLALRFEALPAGLEVRFLAPGSARAVDGAYTAEFLRARADRAEGAAPGRGAASGRAGHRATRSPGSRAPLFWSPVVAGDTIVLELYGPERPRTEELRVRLHRVAHLEVDPLARDLSHIGASQGCEVDAACDPKWLEAADAVAKIVFASGEGSFLCTGQLVSQTGKKQKPFFLTAAHCISSRAEAGSATFYWFFRRAECDGPDPTDVTQTGGGARRMFTTGAENGTSTTDHTLLKLKRSPPDGVSLVGWTLDDAGELLQRKVRGLHHPAGDLLKSSRGRITGEGKITWRPGATFLIQSGQPSTHLEVTWNRGVTEGGSSGSGLYVGRRWPKQYLVGLLSGGLAFCSAPQDPDFYGRFDRTFLENKKVRRKLDPAKQFGDKGSHTGR